MCPTITPASLASTQFTYPGRMEGWVDLGSLIAARQGIEPTTTRSQVRCPNCYATKSPYFIYFNRDKHWRSITFNMDDTHSLSFSDCLPYLIRWYLWQLQTWQHKLVPGVASYHPRPWQLCVLDQCGPAADERCSAPAPGSSEVTPGSCRAVRPGQPHSVTPGPGHGCNDQSAGLTSRIHDVLVSPPYRHNKPEITKMMTTTAMLYLLLMM